MSYQSRECSVHNREIIELCTGPRRQVSGVLASRAGAGQGGGGLSAQGDEPDGWDQAIWNRATGRAGDRGGPRASKARC